MVIKMFAEIERRVDELRTSTKRKYKKEPSKLKK